MPTLNAMFRLGDGYSAKIEKIVTGTDKALQKVENTSKAVDELDGALSKTGKTGQDTGKKFSGFGEDVEELGKKAERTDNIIKGLLTTILSAGTIRAVFQFSQESFNLGNIQKGVERQLAVVLKNVGAAEDAIERLKEKASEIQGVTIYGDEAMLAGASELATYISDTEAIESMMGTLANYAAGMSGGGALDTSAMVDYATQLGKALDGTYDGLTKKGFTLSDQQKAIIESGTDMEKALVIDEVISQSWNGLAESMASLPENRIISIKNTIGDIREEVGNRITPGIMNLYNVIEKYMPQIESLMLGIGNAINVLIFLFGMAADAAGSAASFIDKNWSIIGPIIIGVAGALLLYAGYLAVTKAATVAFTVAQGIMNSTMLGCPLVWIAAAVIGVAAAIYYGVEAFNDWSGASVSATGIICGALATGGAFIWNLIAGVVNAIMGITIELYNLVAGFANAMATMFNNPVAGIIMLFSSLFDFIVGFAQSAAKIIDSVFGSNIADAIGSFRDEFNAGVEDIVGNDKVTVMEKLDASAYQLGRISYGDAYDQGYLFGEGIEEKVSGLLGGIGEYGFEGVATAGNPAVVEGTGQGGTMQVDMADEDIQYLRDLAQREYVAKIANNTLAPNIRVEFTGPVTKEADVDKVAARLGEILKDEIASTAEEVY